MDNCNNPTMLEADQERDALRGLCAELATVLAAHGASSAVMEQVSAVREGRPLPHASLLPYTPNIPAPSAAHKKLSELSMALAFSLCSIDHQGTRRDVRKAQAVLEELRQMLVDPDPVMLEVVAVTRDGDDGLFLDWTVEGGIDALENAGVKLLVAPCGIADETCGVRVAPEPQACGTTSPQYRAELYDEMWTKAREMGYGNVIEALTELERLKSAGQPVLAERQKPAVDPGRVTIDKDIFGTVHIRVGDFDFIQVKYDLRYTHNAHQDWVARQIVAAVFGRDAEDQARGDAIAEGRGHD